VLVSYTTLALGFLAFWRRASSDIDTRTEITVFAFPQNSCNFNPHGLQRYLASGWVGSAVYPLDFASFDLEDDDVVEKMQTWASEVEKKFLEGGY
tara:strand:- start:894 stop:1178 length:285 start_codon:yes stop_codon:yes gene_type:complete